MLTPSMNPSGEKSPALPLGATVASRDSESAAISWAPRPFTRWHLRRKYEVMEGLFRRFVTPHTKLVDMGCGTGEALVLAQKCAPGCELWGVDLNGAFLDQAQSKVPSAKLILGDITKSGILPREYFDIVHEFGAAFMCRDWAGLARIYLSLLKPGGLLLWELPQKWSSAHFSYLFWLAPKRYPGESKLLRIARTALPWKYRFESDARIGRFLDESGYPCAIVEKQPLWYFFARGWSSQLLDFGWKYFGDDLFESIDRTNGTLWPRYSGYYLIVQKSAPPEA